MPELETRLRALAEEAVWPATPDLAAAVAAPRARAVAGRVRRRPRRRPAAPAHGRPPRARRPARGAAARARGGRRLPRRARRRARVARPARGRDPPRARAAAPARARSSRPTSDARSRSRRRAATRGSPPRSRPRSGGPTACARRASGSRWSTRPATTCRPCASIDAGLILTQSRGGIRGVYLQKLLLGGTRVDRVSVRGRLGAFISGGEHAYLYETPGGEVRQDRPLLAGPTLVWTAGGRVLPPRGGRPTQKSPANRPLRTAVRGATPNLRGQAPYLAANARCEGVGSGRR